MTKPCAADCTCSDCADVVLLNGEHKLCECGRCSTDCSSPLVEPRHLRYG